jgi:hypothetical protein
MLSHIGNKESIDGNFVFDFCNRKGIECVRKIIWFLFITVLFFIDLISFVAHILFITPLLFIVALSKYYWAVCTTALLRIRFFLITSNDGTFNSS